MWDRRDEFLEDGRFKARRGTITALLSDLGWFLGNKIGRADEKKEYRRLFKLDDDYHDPATEPAERMACMPWTAAALGWVSAAVGTVGFASADSERRRYASAR